MAQNTSPLAEPRDLKMPNAGPRAAGRQPMRPVAWWAMLLFVVAYVLLDAASFVHSQEGLNLTLWNPAPALGVAFALRWGWRVVPLMLLAAVSAEWWEGNAQIGSWLTWLMAGAQSLVYYATGRVLGFRLRGRAVFRTRQELLVWLTTVSGGVFLASFSVTIPLYIAGQLPESEFAPSLLHYGVGDAVGVLLFLPFQELLIKASGRATLRSAMLSEEGVFLLLSACLMLWVAFGLGEGSEFKYLYCLFLPVIWAGIRLGRVGAFAVVTFLQVGIILAGRLLGYGPVTVLEIQVMLLALGLVGFFVGVVVDELRRLNEELQQSMRLAAAGEMAGALAHELNQPLTALAAYGKACEIMIQKGQSAELLQETISRMRAESARATGVLHRLRDFFRSGATRLEAVNLAALVEDVERRLASRIAESGVEFQKMIAPDLVMSADRLQLEVVLRNLLANAVEAVMVNPPEVRQVSLSARVVSGGKVLLQVVDNGPGVGALAGRVFEPFVSSKGSGLGLGLAISRAIVESHGGALWHEEGEQGVFNLLLPLGGEHEQQ